MAFGKRVTELLDTYSQCLKHLGGPRAVQEAVSSGRPSVSELYRTLESDRDRVRRRYSTRLSETGSRLAKGDGQHPVFLYIVSPPLTYVAGHARSALRRIIRRLQDVLTKLLGSRKAAGGPRVDYGSLCSLSEASRMRAVETIDALSVRLGNIGVPLDKQSKGTASKGARGGCGREKAQPARQRTKSRSSKRQHDEKGPATRRKEADGKRHRDKKRPDSHGGQQGAERGDKRISRVSASSGSTRLGFIPEHKWAQSDETGVAEDEGYYNVRPTYPLRPYHTPPEKVERRKGFWSFLRRSAV
ncbi:hypothetical protein CMQ_6108 [Grosmannia clavigera kw1407]|uniref:Uncharacterized protein n=1 Tax=Grosmannia clavigera (strain kw1407 / UAMH 11150) TaxID=655863 RepID=F0XMC3_GROCL|nr:uncharacterized protein CMQ_6108 [Grosmannia clavigera kw1407]EFX01166.1 hypothetical protein CMQ_6108 [Grosmannia clavigera kw1407]